MTGSDEKIEIGYVARAHGIRGEVLIALHDPTSTTLANAATVWVNGRAYDIRGARGVRQGFLLMLDGIADRNAAEALRGAKLEVLRDDIELADGEILVEDLVGCAVVRDGEPWGTVVGIDAGLQPRLVIHDRGVERLVPLVDQLVPTIDIEARVVVVDVGADWPQVDLDHAYKLPRK
ncbi:MAG: ribosome maturation factor RimM [Deltaproteobacteria bacterium]|nr:ribosome maturation factor RimM [Deltaproteobacteria bacterium]